MRCPKPISAPPRIKPTSTREYGKVPHYENGGRVGPRLLKPGEPVGFRVGPKLLKPGASVEPRIGPYGADAPDED
jgi:hypothetical protein